MIVEIEKNDFKSIYGLLDNTIDNVEIKAVIEGRLILLNNFCNIYPISNNNPRLKIKLCAKFSLSKSNI